MLLAFDIDAEAIAEHDDWHTHEHLPERLSIPGFLRGTRWVAVQGQPRYCVLYEVADLATLRSPAHLERRGAVVAADAVYRLDYVPTHDGVKGRLRPLPGIRP